MAAVSIGSSPSMSEVKLETEAGPSTSSSAPGSEIGLGNGPRPAYGTGGDSSSFDRPPSPVKLMSQSFPMAEQDKNGVAGASAVAAKPQVVAPKHDRPIDMRAEEDAARRLNVGRVAGNSRYAGTEGRGRKTDLCGPEFRMAMQRRARNHQLTIDDEALAYLSMAAETQLRQLLTSTVSAQQHRTTTSYLHPPPFQPSSSGSGSTRPRPMWDVSIQSDPNAVLEALNRQAKEAEREFRTSRMNRLAKEHEMERFRERQAAATGTGGPLSSEGGGGGSMLPPPTVGGATTPSAEINGDDNSPGAHPPSSPDKGAPSPGALSNSTPTFGGPKKFIKSKKNPKDVSADVQIKMSNATAMRSAGMGKKYSWMSSAPSISSPLSGSKKKGKKGTSGLSKAVGAEEEGEGPEAEAEDGVGIEEGGAGGSTPKKRKKNTNGSGDSASNHTHSNGKAKRRKMPTMPNRRMVLTGSDAKGEDRSSPDDRCLTVNDLVFALDREKGGQGMGTSDEVVRRVMARPGGPWGMASGRRA